MKDIHKRSLAKIRELHESMSSEEFLASYFAVKTGVGPTLTEFCEWMKDTPAGRERAKLEANE